jgi:hypothetical protein
MKNLVIYGLVLFLLAVNCMAVSPVQLTGSSGEQSWIALASTTPVKRVGHCPATPLI